MQRSANNNRQMFESSLELKCLFFFGVALLVVITVSFWMYWNVTEALIMTQTETMARSRAKEHLVFEHVRNVSETELSGSMSSTVVTPTSTTPFGMPIGSSNLSLDFRRAITELLGEDSNQPTRVIRRPESFNSQVQPRNMPQDDFEKQLLEKYRKSPDVIVANEGSALIQPSDLERLADGGLLEQTPALIPTTTPNQPATSTSQPSGRSSGKMVTPLEAQSDADDEAANKKITQHFVTKMDANGHYHYYEPRWVEAGDCLNCHRSRSPDMEPGDLIGIVEVTIIDPPSKAVTTDYWVRLLVASILTATLAMLAFYIIIRWIIIKPLRHLRKVSDAISHGDITQRADLHTGDEFESLAMAFNRTIRHILNSQEKLRGINVELDQRVDQLARLNVQLYESNRVKSDFMATMSHELRTPLNSIIGFSEVLSSIDSLDEKQKRYVDNISKSGKTLLSMINDILDMAKIEADRIIVQPGIFNITAIVGAQCDMAKPLADRKNIDIECDMPNQLPSIQQDASRVQQILNNLLSNAIKFTPEGGRIKVQVRRMMPGTSPQKNLPSENESIVPRGKTGRHSLRRVDPLDDLAAAKNEAESQTIREPMLELKVIDTGVGISEEDQLVIFEKFRQGKSSMAEGDAMKREYSGSGLGLSIVKELCRLLDGSVLVESQLGLGSTFTVTLPWTLEPQTRVESEMMADLQEFAKAKPPTKRHSLNGEK